MTYLQMRSRGKGEKDGVAATMAWRRQWFVGEEGE